MFGVKGRRTFKTAAYMDYQNDIRDQLMGISWPFGKEQIYFDVEVGLSNRGADLDNTIKPLLDTYQGIFEDFNDNKVYNVNLLKTIVPKGSEFIRVRIGLFTELPDGERTPNMGKDEQETEEQGTKSGS